MANQIPFSGATPAAGGYLLPPEQGEILTKGVLEESGALSLAGDARTTTSRKTQFPIWLGTPTAAFVGEGNSKPVTGGEFGQAEINVKKVASIVLFTDEQIEDVQNGDLSVLVDSGVRKALAHIIDANAVGKENGSNISTNFDNALRSTSATAIELGTGADALQKAVSAAMGTLEANGYGNPADMGVLLTPTFRQAIRDARDGNNRPLYDSGDSVDPLYGLSRAYSTNLSPASASAASTKVVGYVVHKPNLHVRLRQDVTVKVSTEATVNDGTDDRHLFQENLTAIRYELRPAFMVHDVNRAVVPIVDAS